MDRAALLARYRQLADQLRALTATLSPEDAARPADDGGWSIAETIGECERYQRSLDLWIDGITTQEMPSLPALSASITPDLSVYRAMPVAAIIDSLERYARSNADKLERLTDAQLQRQFVRQSGEVSELEGLITRIIQLADVRMNQIAERLPRSAGD